MRDLKVNLDQALYVDSENKSVTSGMINTIQRFETDKDNIERQDVEENE